MRGELLSCDDLDTVPAAIEELKAGVTETVTQAEIVPETEAELRRVEESRTLLVARPDVRPVPDALIDAAKDEDCTLDREIVVNADSDPEAKADVDASADSVDDLDVKID